MLLYVDDIILTDNHSTLFDKFISPFPSVCSERRRWFCIIFLVFKLFAHLMVSIYLSRNTSLIRFLSIKRIHVSLYVPLLLLVLVFLSFMVNFFSNPSEYMSMLGDLQYLTMTRSNISYVVNVVSQFMHDLPATHLHCVKHSFRYLQVWTIHACLIFNFNGGFLLWLG